MARWHTSVFSSPLHEAALSRLTAFCHADTEGTFRPER